jgi:hypothetical protein
MWDGIKSRLSYANVMATVAVFLALGGGAYALTGVPDRRGVFHGCVSNKTGVLRVVKTTSACVKPKLHGKHRTLGEFAVAWNQRGARGRPGAPGRAGPGAVNLYFDRAPDNQLVNLGTVGAWTIKALCWAPGVSVPTALKLFIDGPGSADAAYSDQTDGATTTTLQQHQDLSADSTLFSFGQKGGHQDRAVGTIVLSADSATPVGQVSFVTQDDAATPGGRCSVIGVATSAG